MESRATERNLGFRRRVWPIVKWIGSTRRYCQSHGVRCRSAAYPRSSCCVSLDVEVPGMLACAGAHLELRRPRRWAKPDGRIRGEPVAREREALGRWHAHHY